MESRGEKTEGERISLTLDTGLGLSGFVKRSSAPETRYAADGKIDSVSATEGIIPFSTRSMVIVWLHTPCELK